MSKSNEELGYGFTSLFLQIDNETDFIEAISNDVADPQTASLIWHSLQSMYTSLEQFYQMLESEK